MTNAYGLKGAPGIGKGLPGLPSRGSNAVSQAYGSSGASAYYKRSSYSLAYPLTSSMFAFGPDDTMYSVYPLNTSSPVVLEITNPSGIVLSRRTLVSGMTGVVVQGLWVGPGGHVALSLTQFTSGSTLYGPTVMMFSPTGALLWQRCGNNTSYSVVSVAMDASGNAYVGWVGNANWPMVEKINTAGVLQWYVSIVSNSNWADITLSPDGTTLWLTSYYASTYKCLNIWSINPATGAALSTKALNLNDTSSDVTYVSSVCGSDGTLYFVVTSTLYPGSVYSLKKDNLTYTQNRFTSITPKSIRFGMNGNLFMFSYTSGGPYENASILELNPLNMSAVNGFQFLTNDGASQHKVSPLTNNKNWVWVRGNDVFKVPAVMVPGLRSDGSCTTASVTTASPGITVSTASGQGSLAAPSTSAPTSATLGVAMGSDANATPAPDPQYFSSRLLLGDTYTLSYLDF